MPLNDMLCRNAKPKEKTYRLTDGEGMFLEIKPNGTQSWCLKYYLHGKAKRIVLGKYPSLSLLDARKKRTAIKEGLRKGIDPVIEKDTEKRLAKYKASQTFEQVAREWYLHNIDNWQGNHAKYVLRRLENHTFGEIGQFPIHTLTPQHVLACLQKIEKSSPETAYRILSMCSKIFHYAGVTGRLDKDLTFGLKGVLKRYKKGHFPSVEVDELPKLLKAIYTNDDRRYKQTSLAMRLMLLTFVRTTELIHAKWDEFNFEKALWSIPAERMKMRKSHLVPLSKQAVQILQELKERNGKRDYVFPSIPHPRKPMSNCTILNALKRMGYKGKMTGHGFRALAMGVIKEKLNYRHEVVDRQLAHEPKSTVDRAYDRAHFLPQRTLMMQEYADYLDSVLLNQQTEGKDNGQQSITTEINQPAKYTTTVTSSYRVSYVEGNFTGITSKPQHVSEWH